jgi:hypothetical protein
MLEKGMRSSKSIVILIDIMSICSLEEDNEEPENYSLEDIKTKLMVLDEKVADDMWFL